MKQKFFSPPVLRMIERIISAVLIAGLSMLLHRWDVKNAELEKDNKDLNWFVDYFRR